MEINRVKPCQYPLGIDGIFKEALDCVNDFITFFQNSSKMLFLYESDVQADLLVRLKKRIPPLSFSKIEGKDVDNVYQLTLITSEYPVGIRFDLVCINPYMVEDYVKYHAQEKLESKINNIFWELPLLFGIEAKFSSYGTDGSRSEGIHEDYKKLQNYGNHYHLKRLKERFEKSHSAQQHFNPPTVNFSKDFKFLSLGFYHKQSNFNNAKRDLLNKNLSVKSVSEINEWNCIYLVICDKILQFK